MVPDRQLPTLSPETTVALTSPDRRLIAAFLAGRSPQTLRAYSQDLGDFSAFLGVATPEAAAWLLLGQGQGEANGIGLAYRAQMLERGLAPATVNRRLAAVRSLVALARMLGLSSVRLEVPGVKAEMYRDTRGPGAAGVRHLLGLLDGRDGAKAVRDRAIVRCLFDLGLRRGEVVGLDLVHLDLAAGTMDVLGKGRTGRERLSLPEPTCAALAAWVAARGQEPGPLFLNFDHAGKGQRLTGTSIYRIVRALGSQAGLTVHPHGLRHAAITEALDLTRGDVRAVQRFSRHRDLRVLTVYDDTRRDLGGEVARLVAGVA
jgi:integrase/recombinase XerC